MNKGDLIKVVAENAKLTQADAQAAVDATFQAIIHSLSEGQEATFVGFGTFKVSERAARKGRNPKTGEEIDIGASKSPSFKAGKAFKEAVK